MGFDVAGLIIRRLDKDDGGVPTPSALSQLLMDIDLGVRESGWGLQKRRVLMERLRDAAQKRLTQLETAIAKRGH